MIKPLSQKEFDLNMTDKSGRVPLQACAYQGDRQIAKLLLRMGARINFRGGNHGSAIHTAIDGLNWPMLEFLVKHPGANLNIGHIELPGRSTSLSLDPPLFHALKTRRRKAVLILVHNGTGLDVKNAASAQKVSSKAS
ncbi:ankyrin repeat-containing domain protein [Podospora fimiseda]|uniref:Ankyrin repeat-containing domain protein n=1 Tax=Podospora fimiseda TaxID=252190 RepID=A0AAN7GUB1_9PEZI|nr:ankyrin repeat-containing domain protein [Podospora fimiseda]